MRTRVGERFADVPSRRRRPLDNPREPPAAFRQLYSRRALPSVVFVVATCHPCSRSGASVFSRHVPLPTSGARDPETVLDPVSVAESTRWTRRWLLPARNPWPPITIHAEKLIDPPSIEEPERGFVAHGKCLGLGSEHVARPMMMMGVIPSSSHVGSCSRNMHLVTLPTLRRAHILVRCLGVRASPSRV